jgi:hypothetical protein
MFYVIDNFYHISSSLYAYRSLPLPRGGDGQAAAAFSRQSRRVPAVKIFSRGRTGKFGRFGENPPPEKNGLRPAKSIPNQVAT